MSHKLDKTSVREHLKTDLQNAKKVPASEKEETLKEVRHCRLLCKVIKINCFSISSSFDR